MTTHTQSLSIFVITVAVFVGLILGGVIIGTAVWPRANAATRVSGIDVTAIMSNVDVAKLPATELPDR